MDPIKSLPLKCNSGRAKNCRAVVIDFDLNKRSFKIKSSTEFLEIPIESFPQLRDRILKSDKAERRLLRRELERGISERGPIQVSDLIFLELETGFLLKGPAEKNYLIPSTCRCLRAYLLFTMSSLIARLDDFETKFLNFIQKGTK